MLSRLRLILIKDCYLEFNRTAIVGVSGGADSLFLLDVLWRLEIPLIVAHYNHQLQLNADEAAVKVESLASQMNLKFVGGKGEVKKIAEEGGYSIEEAARIMRYRFLFGKAKHFNAQAVIVGHNADDQVETLLMHLITGSGLKGLSGMAYRSLPTPWSENIPLVRPLLGVWRDEILAYLAERNLEPIKDPSNQDVAFLRNSVRHELIPSLEEYNPKVRQAIWNTANVLREDFTILESSFGDAWQECFLEEGSSFIGFNIDRLKNQPVGIQRYIFRGAMALVMPDTREIDYGLIRKAIDFLNSSSRTGECELTEMVYILKEDQYLWVYSKDASLPDSAWPQFYCKTTMEIEVPGKLNLNEKWMMEAAYIRNEDISQDQVFSNQNPFRVFIDVSKVKPPLVIRNRRPGDRIKPLGMKGKSMKLAHFMVNQKIPRRARENWPLVCDSEEILWVPGYCSSHISRVSEKTKNIIKMNLIKGDGF